MANTPDKIGNELSHQGCILYYITLQTIYSGLSKTDFKDHYGDAATQQCLGMIAEINEFSVSHKILYGSQNP